MRSLLSFIFVFFAATALAGQDTPIRTLDEAGQYLARISGASLRAYSTGSQAPVLSLFLLTRHSPCYGSSGGPLLPASLRSSAQHAASQNRW